MNEDLASNAITVSHQADGLKKKKMETTKKQKLFGGEQQKTEKERKLLFVCPVNHDHYIRQYRRRAKTKTTVKKEDGDY